MWRLQQRMATLRVTGDGGRQVAWGDVCLRVPLGDEGSGETAGLAGAWAALGRNKDFQSLREGVCQAVEAWPRRCLENSLLELWGGDEERIAALTDQKVLRDVNAAGPRAAEALRMLGGVRRDAAGRVVAAAAALHTWTTRVQVNSSSSSSSQVEEESTGRRIDLAGMRWEEALVAQVRGWTVQEGEAARPLVLAGHSLGRDATRAVVDDLKWAGVGGAVLVAYVAATATPPLPVLLCLLLGLPLVLLAAYGLCAALGVPFSFLGVALPVLAAGLGVDHMYVLATAWGAAEREGGGERSVVELGGSALRRVGAAITLACLTDSLAFLVGASTRLPGVRWFCLYAATAVACVLLLHVTLFLAALSLHHRRQHAAAASTRCSPPPCRGDLLPRVMTRYAELLLRPGTSAAVVAGAAALLGAGAWGAASLRHQLTLAEWLLPLASPVRQMLEAHRHYFPRHGVAATVYFANVTLPRDLPGLAELATALRASSSVHKVDAWFTVFLDLLPPLLPRPLPPQLFHEALALFLHLPQGARFAWDLEFASPLRCLEAAPRVTAFRVHLKHRPLASMAQQQVALREVQELVSAARVEGFRGAWAHEYSQWEAGGVVVEEAGRGLALVAALVGVVTLAVVGAGRAAALVVGCVAVVLVEVVAAVHAAGLTLNTVTTTALVLAAGLSVDHAAHVAHAFTAARGTRRERARAALQGVGPPVVHAGVSTLLAFVSLAPAASMLFIAYCTVLTAVAALSLLHGLVLLPVLLAWLGPHRTTTPTPPPPPSSATHTISRPNTPPPPPPQPPATASTPRPSTSPPYTPHLSTPIINPSQHPLQPPPPLTNPPATCSPSPNPPRPMVPPPSPPSTATPSPHSLPPTPPLPPSPHSVTLTPTPPLPPPPPTSLTL